MYYEFKRLTDDYAADVEFSNILYNPNQLKNIYSSCQDAMITIHPHQGTSYKYKSKDVYKVPASESRCNDKFHNEETYPPELYLPPDYSLHSTRGVSLLLNYLSTNLFALAETPGVHENIVKGPINEEQFLILEEVVRLEGTDALNFIKTMVHDRLLMQIANSDGASTATYLVGIIYSLILAIWYFRPLLRNFSAEIRHNRACKFFL